MSKFTQKEVVLIKKCLTYESMVARLEKRIMDQTRELASLRKLKEELAPLLHLVDFTKSEAA